MPLTLDCLCGAPGSLMICELAALDLEVRGILQSVGGFQTSDILELNASDGNHGTLTNFEGTFSIPLSLDVVDIWASLEVHFGIAATLSQGCSPGSVGIAKATWRIKQTYSCSRSDTAESTEKVVYAYTTESDECKDDRPGESCYRAVVAGGGAAIDFAADGDWFSGATGLQFASSPLGGGECSIDIGGFYPPPTATMVDAPSSEIDSICLCASGGNPPYLYFLDDGFLPSGVTLDGETGCLQGTPSGFAGTLNVTFKVRDSSFPPEVAYATCGIRSTCSGGPVVAKIPNVFR